MNYHFIVSSSAENKALMSNGIEHEIRRVKTICGKSFFGSE